MYKGGVRFRQASTRVRLGAAATVAVCLAAAAPGSAIAVSGSSLSGDAGAAQYRPLTPPAPLSDVLPDVDQGGPPTLSDPRADRRGTAPDGDRGETLGAGEPGGNVPVAAIAADVTSDNSLPFTGLAAIPLLAGGALLAVGGIALRRRLSRAPTA